ncbi:MULTISPECIES: amidohydrolase [Pasteurellaceae]|uniref:Amidohydrolase n=1 Tax=Pasteurella atlantica TaxID=2827233 RepID=A0AAW8CFF5_9PAST|nr:amidohydrolase [Pasteurella atlantica]MBR0572856.1 amidohydrolase [Pasteurella atlantica]MDP8038784.1 amidohydrolase [Pasteurella atlantica]MDP8040875.1 amidohydrolase [Pasteurella atlantica]MDP8042951.1 amidohydrolase [Pasteurella atlantica]MDP8045038.1 amidohydrolase [Pasteurella atlantica]
MKKINILAKLFAVSTSLLSCLTASADETSGKVYFNGDIITMETQKPQYAEALVVNGSKIAFVGKLKEAEKKFKNIIKVDLEGKTLLPGFIDPHSHFANLSNAMGQVNLSPPPVGETTTITQILEKIKKYKEDNKIPDGEWIFATGYDDSQLSEKRHPTRKEIDSVLPNNPVYLDHTSGHMGVANSKALKLMKIDANTKDPAGGNIGRYPDSNEPNGLMQETAMYPFVGNMLQILSGKASDYFISTQDFYAKNGFTTAQDGMADRNKIKFYQEKAKNNALKIDINVLAGAPDLDKNLNDKSMIFKTYNNHFKLQGTKVIGDGSPQGKTAFFTKPYLTKVDGCEKDCKGLPSVTQEKLNKIFVTAYEKDNQLFVHSNGDASIDMIIKAHENACKQLKLPLDKDRRTIVIHSQFVRPDQLKTFVKYKIAPSFFTNHAFFWGDVHLENLGKERAAFLSPIVTADKLGLKYTNHSDATVTPLNPLMGIWSAVNRETRSGVIVGESERATPYQALKAITINAAYEHFDEKIKGSLKVGKLADLVILDKNPIKEEPKKIKEIKVVETIKEGKTIFKTTSF